MNLKMILYILGYIMRIEGAFFLLPLIVGLYYKDDTILAFLVTILVLFVVGYMLSYKKPKIRLFMQRKV